MRISLVARAQTYPSRPVRIIVGFPAGGNTDMAARLIGQSLSERLRRQFFVENHPGAAGNIGTEAVGRAPADGYTLLMAADPNAINATVYELPQSQFYSRHRADSRNDEPADGNAR
jgi:tripartite-type tricarboxylate transporter receptor subunit TctC